jgi:hypothetical protein
MSFRAICAEIPRGVRCPNGQCRRRKEELAPAGKSEAPLVPASDN